jgi:hypothetical protein
MKLNQIASNLASVEIGQHTIYFSYETPVAFHDGTRLNVSQNQWTVTTAKHLTKIDGGNKANRLPADEFNERLRTEFNLDS